ncbi:MAG: BREX system Lon protease-like protein BrxL [Thermoguttaceae bacterium]|nr:BREX system Lon protease-like protein BrxL [Thermoguttaceae bacterium]
MNEKLRNVFDGMVVYKDLKRTALFSTLSLPSFMRDWLLEHFEVDESGVDFEELNAFIREMAPSREDWNILKSQLVAEGEPVKIFAKISVDVNIKKGEIAFNLPDYGLSSAHTLIDPSVWQEIKNDLDGGRETWGLLRLGYRFPDLEARPKVDGKIKLLGFKNFCPYSIDLEFFKDARGEFETCEWIDLLLGAIDYNAKGYVDKEQKLTMLTRLLPFVEKRLNLIELAPKGTGKSYLYGRVSRFGWLSNGGVMSRAKMFYDQNRRREGLVAGYDFVILDEVQTIRFSDVDEMRAALKGYLEQGTFTVGDYEGRADAGLVLSGNVPMDAMETDGYGNMFETLPTVFHESALIDRFHGLIRGWNVPRMHDDLKISGWALNSEYFTSILHELRDDVTYRAIVDELIVVPERADTRDVEAVKRVATAYLKLLFPHVRTPGEITRYDFKTYCLNRAVAMRDLIKRQLAILDPKEFGGKDLPKFEIREI